MTWMRPFAVLVHEGEFVLSVVLLHPFCCCLCFLLLLFIRVHLRVPIVFNCVCVCVRLARKVGDEKRQSVSQSVSQFVVSLFPQLAACWHFLRARPNSGRSCKAPVE